LKKLDDFSFRRLAVCDNIPILPQVIKIQRYIRSYLRKTRLKRCVRDGMKVWRMVQNLEALNTLTLMVRPFVNFRVDKEIEEVRAEKERERLEI